MMGYALGEHEYLTRNEFDPATRRRRFEVGIRCRRCAKEEWLSAPDAGWGRRLFKKKGWDCGNGVNRHTCPDCLAGKTRTPATKRAKAREALPGVEVATRAIQDPLPEPTLAEVHHLPEPPRPIIHVHNPQEESPPMTAIAAAMETDQRPAQTKTIKARGKPFGFTLEGNAAQAARRALMNEGVVNPERGRHYKTHRSADGTWSYEILTRKGGGLPVDALRSPPRIRVVEGYRVQRRDHAVRAASLLLNRRGIATAMEGVHYEISGSPGEGYIYRLLPAADPAPPATPEAPKPTRACGGGHLSRYDARKDALAVLQAVRKTGGAPIEGVDYWVTQDGFNLWGWTTTNPTPPKVENQAQPEPPKVKEEAVGEVVTIAESPRAPTPAENRRIMDALDEHYDSERGRYRQSFNDAAVSHKLDLPRAWVKKVREEFFGPEANEADVEAQRQKLAVLERGVETATAALNKAQAILEAAAELETVLGEMKRLLAEARRP